MIIDPLVSSSHLYPKKYAATTAIGAANLYVPEPDTAAMLLVRMKSRVATLKQELADVESKRSELDTLERMIAASQNVESER